MAGHVFVIHGDITRCKADAIGFSTSTGMYHTGQLYRAFTQLDPTFAKSYNDLSHTPWSIGDTYFLAANASRPAVVVTFSVGRGHRKDPLESAALLVRRTIECAVRELRKDKPNERLLVLVPSFLTGDGGKEDMRPELARAQVRSAVETVRELPNVDAAFVLFSPADHQIYRAARRHEVPDLFADVTVDPTLLSAVRDRECVVFVGSGISAGAGMKGWGAFVHELCKHLGPEVKPTDPAGYLSAAQKYRDACKADATLPTIENVVRGLFGPEVPVSPTIAHYLIASLQSQYVVTTNYDHLLEKTYAARRHEKLHVTVVDSIPASSKHGRVNIVKFHGDAVDGGVIASTEDYANFDKTHSAFGSLLGGLLLNHTFLFLGYSLSDSTFNAVYESIKVMLGRAHRPAYATVFTNLDQNAPTNVSTIDFGGTLAEQTAALWHWLDALADQLSHPVLLADTTHADAVVGQALQGTRKALRTAGDEIVAAIKDPALTEAEAWTLAGIAEVLCRHGWRSAMGNSLLFTALAQRIREPDRRAFLLRTAQLHAESVNEVEAAEKAGAGTT